MTQITRGQFAIAAVVVAVLAWMGAHAGPSRPRTGEAAPTAIGTPVTPATTDGGEPGTAAVPATPSAGSPAATVQRAPRSQLVVHVAGAVRRPGVYRLKDGQRVADAVRRAGGGTRSADLDAINLATKVRDGVQILVPRKGTAGAPATAAGGPAAAKSSAQGAAGTPAVVDLNTATAEQLETLDGVGPATSAKILQYRAEHGPFRSVDDLEAIPGIGPKKLAAVRARARV